MKEQETTNIEYENNEKEMPKSMKVNGVEYVQKKTAPKTPSRKLHPIDGGVWLDPTTVMLVGFIDSTWEHEHLELLDMRFEKYEEPVMVAEKKDNDTVETKYGRYSEKFFKHAKRILLAFQNKGPRSKLDYEVYHKVDPETDEFVKDHPVVLRVNNVYVCIAPRISND